MVYSRGRKIVALVTSLLLSIVFFGCERDLSIGVGPTNPPVFKLRGSGRLVFFYVLEVPPNHSPSADSPKLWEIRPTENNKISDLPAITYGVVPSGFIQTIPSSGQAPALVEKKTYEAGGPAFDANGGSVRFVLEGGKAVLIQKARNITQ